jgi:putative phosphoesterase
MTKIAVLSDIHGNWEALQAVVQLDRYKECDVKCFCGDALGYYYDSEDVVTYLKEMIHNSILGNHDRIFIAKYLNGSPGKIEYEQKYGSALKLAAGSLTTKNKEWLKSLQEKAILNVAGKTIQICHGSPWDPDLYIYPDSDNAIAEKVFAEACSIVLIGHSHYQFHWEKRGKHVVNPGSVGQARKKGGLAEWAEIDIDGNSIHVHLFQIPYSIDRLVGQVSQNDPDIPYLKSILLR